MKAWEKAWEKALEEHSVKLKELCNKHSISSEDDDKLACWIRRQTDEFAQTCEEFLSVDD